eukprot:TRINITY_DN6438_c0_g1_i7.p1 TRINITY_DN6438_c0_g1~~TRINITY_DN6438_c0_g1_i7.p1  ORF type:complete len:180 (-),score=17.15 TRINITY_DN6438_c0_g1_i7:68-532(-)
MCIRDRYQRRVHGDEEKQKSIRFNIRLFIPKLINYGQGKPPRMSQFRLPITSFYFPVQVYIGRKRGPKNNINQLRQDIQTYKKASQRINNMSYGVNPYSTGMMGGPSYWKPLPTMTWVPPSAIATQQLKTIADQAFWAHDRFRNGALELSLIHI